MNDVSTAGNDRLNARYGSDSLDGGSGHDTARIRGNFGDYPITSDAQPLGPADGDIGSIEGITFTLTNERTGDTVTAKNIENFKFNDQRLSGLELFRHAAPTPPSNS